MVGYILETPAFGTPSTTFADNCREIATVICEKENDFKTQKAINYYNEMKEKILENAKNGLFYYSFCLEDDIILPLKKILEENGFAVEGENVYSGGHFIRSNLTIWWK